jgi:hypothetical protein
MEATLYEPCCRNKSNHPYKFYVKLSSCLTYKGDTGTFTIELVRMVAFVLAALFMEGRFHVEDEINPSVPCQLIRGQPTHVLKQHECFKTPYCTYDFV